MEKRVLVMLFYSSDLKMLPVKVGNRPPGGCVGDSRLEADVAARRSTTYYLVNLNFVDFFVFPCAFAVKK